MNTCSINISFILYSQLEAEKNKLENLLKNNLLRKIERIQAEMTEMTGEDRKNRLELARVELETINTRINENNMRFRGDIPVLHLAVLESSPFRIMEIITALHVLNCRLRIL